MFSVLGGIETEYLPSTKQMCYTPPSHAVTSVFLIQKVSSVESGTSGTVGVRKPNFRPFFRDPLITSTIEHE